LALIIQLSISSSTYATGSTSDCNPAPQSVAELVTVREKFHTVRGPLAKFDPCHRSVEPSMYSKLFGPKVEGKPPLVIIAHGGGGLDRLRTKRQR